MKTALIAVMCTLEAAACGGETKPADAPATQQTTSSTSVTTTEGSRSASGVTTPTPATQGQPSPSMADRTSPLPAAPAGGSTPTAGTTNAAAPSAANGTPPVAQNPGAADGTKDATNTKMNERDRGGAALTPMDQGGGKDRDITAAVRRSVVADGSLSFNAKNVKIITVAGKVTLRGPVKSDAEKATIEAKTKATAGVTEVDNQLEVKK